MNRNGTFFCSDKAQLFAFLIRVNLTTCCSIEEISDCAVEIDEHEWSSVLEQPCCPLIFNNLLLWEARTERMIENCVSLIKVI